MRRWKRWKVSAALILALQSYQSCELPLKNLADSSHRVYQSETVVQPFNPWEIRLFVYNKKSKIKDFVEINHFFEKEDERNNTYNLLRDTNSRACRWIDQRKSRWIQFSCVYLSQLRNSLHCSLQEPKLNQRLILHIREGTFHGLNDTKLSFKGRTLQALQT